MDYETAGDKTRRDDEPITPPNKPRRWTAGWLAVGFLIGCMAAVVGGLIVLAVWNRDSLTEVTEQRLDEAEDLWERKGPASYNLDVEVVGPRSGAIHVEVRGGVVSKMTIDGRAPSQQRTWYYWTVPGQLDMIRADLENAKNPREAFGVRETSEVVLRGEFDARYGFPKEYQRLAGGGAAEIRWEVTNFEVVE